MLEQQISMFLILFGVAAIPFLARRLRVPSAALEIVYGMLLFNFSCTSARTGSTCSASSASST
jgi:Kef-type K+ transport system membrane component KefB